MFLTLKQERNITANILKPQGIFDLDQYPKLESYDKENLKVFQTLNQSNINKGRELLAKAKQEIPDVYQDLIDRVISPNNFYNQGLEDPLLHAQIYFCYAIANEIPPEQRGWRANKAEVAPWKNLLSHWIRLHYGGSPYWWRSIIAIGISGAGFELKHDPTKRIGDYWSFNATPKALNNVLKKLQKIP